MPTPITWEPDCGYSIQEVQQEVDRQRIALGMQPQHDEEAEREASTEWYSGELGDYNRSIYVGVDLGKKSDYSAAILLEPFLPRISSVDNVLLGNKQFHYHIVQVHRYNHKPYTTIARNLKNIYNQLTNSKKWRYVYFIIDEGGVGAGVTDQVVELIPNAYIYRCTLTGGNKVVWHDALNFSLPKPQMVSTMIALFNAGRVHIPEKAADTEKLRQELFNYRTKVTEKGYDQFGAMKTGEFDDLACAMGFALWIAEEKGGGSKPLFW